MSSCKHLSNRLREFLVDESVSVRFAFLFSFFMYEIVSGVVINDNLVDL